MKYISCILTLFLLNSVYAQSRANRADSIDKANNKSIIESGTDITKAYILLSEKDSTIYLTANMRKDHRIFGYANPDITSERLLLFSIFTDDVEDNPFVCRLGAYYDTNGMKDLTLQYQATGGKFIKAVAVDKSNHRTVLYFEKKWIEFQ